MAREITQRQLRNSSGEVMRALDAGVSFLLTRNGVPVGELTPFEPRGFVSREAVRKAFSKAVPMNFERLRTDLDEVADQDTTPRA